MKESARTYSLALVAASWTALAMAVAMAVYGLLQLWLSAGARPEAVVLEHSLHILLLGVVVYLVLSAALRRVVVAPLRAINRHLYGVATGHVDPIELDSAVEEVRELANAVNLMVARIRLHRDEPALIHASEDLAAIGELAAALAAADPERGAELPERLDRLGRALRSAW